MIELVEVALLTGYILIGKGAIPLFKGSGIVLMWPTKLFCPGTAG